MNIGFKKSNERKIFGEFKMHLLITNTELKYMYSLTMSYPKTLGRAKGFENTQLL